MLALVSCGAGFYLGLSFRVFILMPVTIFAIAAFYFSCWATGYHFFENIGTLLFLLVATNVGYLLGLTTRGAFGHVRTIFGPQSERI